jgi:hypothetical protein
MRDVVALLPRVKQSFQWLGATDKTLGPLRSLAGASTSPQVFAQVFLTNQQL